MRDWTNASVHYLHTLPSTLLCMDITSIRIYGQLRVETQNCNASVRQGVTVRLVMFYHYAMWSHA